MIITTSHCSRSKKGSRNLAQNIHKFDWRYGVRADLNSFEERIYLGGSTECGDENERKYYISNPLLDF
jgi:hypothetical protein